MVSIHAPAGGATLCTGFTPHRQLFQSTLPQGERQKLANFECFFERFNPRSRRGSDDRSLRFPIGGSTFQSTLPQGERHKTIIAVITTNLFQSTLPQGERHRKRTVCRRRCRVQSTLPQGERPLPFSLIPDGEKVSIQRFQHWRRRVGGAHGEGA